MVVPLHMGWRNVLFANWPVDPETVRPHVPEALALDTFDGDAWLSVVPFTNVDVRPDAAPPGTGLPLPELNLRTYVSDRGGDGGGDDGDRDGGDADGRPGVYFFSLDAQGILSVLGARAFHYLPYYYARISLSAADGGVEFRSRRVHPGARPVQFRATYGPTGEQFRADDGSLAEFLTERYRYYTEDTAGAIRYADIDHEPWALFDADATFETNTLFRANCFDPPESEPVHFYSPGVDVVASKSKRR
ncbi:YqjF family protein [Halobaculum sp. D14]|uniref:YqjF family protein n=1 Tax=Halobaculum sp. D14 TaxID=3421642 RepID=UPI003EBEC855